MIDPGRKRQNEERAKKLIAFSREIRLRLQDGDESASEASGALHRALYRNWPIPPIDSELRTPVSAELVSAAMIEQAIEPLREAIADLKAKKSPIVVTMNNTDYKVSAPGAFDSTSQTLSARLDRLTAPLTLLTCPNLVEDALHLQYVILDPSRYKPLSIEQPHYARERTKLIELEHRLWKTAWQHGAPNDLIPYAVRPILLVLAWHPSAHEPPGAYTICVRCGELLFRKKRASNTPPRCPACMKETPAQREWPPHAIAPHGRATWILRCQYPNCDLSFEGPRHQELCFEHTSSKLPPGRRRTARRPSSTD